jgi:hypothetical protein
MIAIGTGPLEEVGLRCALRVRFGSRQALRGWSALARISDLEFTSVEVGDGPIANFLPN